MNNTTRDSSSSTTPPVGVAVHGRETSEGHGRGHGSKHGSDPGSRPGRGHGRGRGRRRRRGRGRVSGSEDGIPDTTTTEHVDVDQSLPPVGGTWEQDKEPDSLLFTYTGKHGSNVPFTADTSAVDLFYNYFTEDVWALLVTETNRYAQQNLSEKPSARVWTEVSVEEMKAFIGLLITMGIVKLPRFTMYWQKSSCFISTGGIFDVMSKTRFQGIFRFLHLADSSQEIPQGEPGHDRLYKVRKLLDILTTQFESSYTPSEHVTIDEAMICFKGQLGFKQYIKDKPTKWGIKVFTLSDAINGYVYRFQIYTGKNIDDSVDVGLCSRVCLELMSGLEPGFKLLKDNYYTSPRLYLALYKLGYNCCGTVRTNRKDFPKDLIITKAVR